MTNAVLATIYRSYIACLNHQDWPNLCQFVDDSVSRNGQHLGLSGYRRMLERDFEEIPDLHFEIELLIADPPYIASRLAFDCSPKGTFLGLAVNGKQVSFTENVFYEFREGKIVHVWSVIDKTAIEAQASTRARVIGRRRGSPLGQRRERRRALPGSAPSIHC